MLPISNFSEACSDAPGAFDLTQCFLVQFFSEVLQTHNSKSSTTAEANSKIERETIFVPSS
jgi:hypothetical protein